MKITPNQWIEIVKLISTFVIGIITTLFIQSCTLALSASKNNSNSAQQTEQSTSTKVDSVSVNLKR